MNQGAVGEEGQSHSTTFLPPLSLRALMKLVAKLLQASLFPFFFPSQGLMIFTSRGFKYFCVAMKIKSSFSFQAPPPTPLSSSWNSTLFPKPVADILFSGAHPTELVKHKEDLNVTKEARHANKQVVYNH